MEYLTRCSTLSGDPAVATALNLRTTILVFVVDQMGLKEGQKMDWKVDKVDSKWIAVIR